MCDCDRALELISLRLDGMLCPDEAAELEAHLSACPDCGAAAQALEEIHAAMPELVESPPEGFHQRVMERIAAETVIPFPTKKTGARVWKNWLSTAAVFAVVLLGGGSLLRSSLLGHAPGAAAPPPAPMAISAPEAPVSGEGAAPEATPAPAGAPQAQTYGGDVGAAEAADQERGKQLSSPAPEVYAVEPAALPTAPPQGTPVPAQNGAVPEENAPEGEPRTVLQVRMPTPAEAAAQTLGQTQWPDGTLTLLYDEADGLLGLRVELEGGAGVTLTCLGLSPNGLYWEFQPEGQETDRFAVSQDGGGILLRQSDQAAYDAAVKE